MINFLSIDWIGHQLKLGQSLEYNSLHVYIEGKRTLILLCHRKSTLSYLKFHSNYCITTEWSPWLMGFYWPECKNHSISMSRSSMSSLWVPYVISFFSFEFEFFVNFYCSSMNDALEFSANFSKIFIKCCWMSE